MSLLSEGKSGSDADDAIDAIDERICLVGEVGNKELAEFNPGKRNVLRDKLICFRRSVITTRDSPAMEQRGNNNRNRPGQAAPVPSTSSNNAPSAPAPAPAPAANPNPAAALNWAALNVPPAPPHNPLLEPGRIHPLAQAAADDFEVQLTMSEENTKLARKIESKRRKAERENMLSERRKRAKEQPSPPAISHFPAIPGVGHLWWMTGGGKDGATAQGEGREGASSSSAAGEVQLKNPEPQKKSEEVLAKLDRNWKLLEVLATSHPGAIGVSLKPTVDDIQRNDPSTSSATGHAFRTPPKKKLLPVGHGQKAQEARVNNDNDEEEDEEEESEDSSATPPSDDITVPLTYKNKVKAFLENTDFEKNQFSSQFKEVKAAIVAAALSSSAASTTESAAVAGPSSATAAAATTTSSVATKAALSSTIPLGGTARTAPFFPSATNPTFPTPLATATAPPSAATQSDHKASSKNSQAKPQIPHQSTPSYPTQSLPPPPLPQLPPPSFPVPNFLMRPPLPPQTGAAPFNFAQHPALAAAAAAVAAAAAPSSGPGASRRPTNVARASAEVVKNMAKETVHLARYPDVPDPCLEYFRLYKEGLYTDVTIITDDSQFDVHRLVLAGNSKYVSAQQYFFTVPIVPFPLP